jgi:hypothetical protein
LRKLFEDASESGFINPENLSLVSIVDLPEGEAANADESKAGEWGEAAVKALRDWSVSVSGMSRSLPAVPGLVATWSYLCEPIHYTAHSPLDRARTA